MRGRRIGSTTAEKRQTFACDSLSILVVPYVSSRIAYRYIYKMVLFSSWVQPSAEKREMGNFLNSEEEKVSVVMGSSTRVDISATECVSLGCIDVSKSPSSRSNDKMPSYMMNTGGSVVWCMDWSPYDEDAEASYLAVAAHSKAEGLHQLGKTYSGNHAVQVWRASDKSADTSTPKSNNGVELVLNLVHEGGVAWAVSWCPAPRGLIVTEERLGLVAGALGDGSVCIWSVPRIPDMVDSDVTSLCVDPVATLGPDHVDGSIPCTIDWLPHVPYDLLLVGYQDGYVSIVKLMDGGAKQQRLKVIQYFPSDSLTLTSSLWFPAISRSGRYANDIMDIDTTNCFTNTERHAFVTCGHESVVTVWDSRTEYTPRVTVKTNSAFTIQDMCWTTDPLGLMMAMEDGTIRGFLMDPTAMKNQLKSGRPVSLITYRGSLPGAMWAVAATGPSMLTKNDTQTIVYGGEDGIVGIVAEPQYPYVSKKRSAKHMPLVGLVSECKGTFRILTSDEIQKKYKNGLYTGSVYERKKAMELTKGEFTEITQTIYSMEWSSDNGHGQWLAYGNGAGLVHCIWVPSS